MKVLRPQLYERLKHRFGDVKISNHGQAIRWGVRVVDGRPRRFIDKRHGHHQGESYVVCCPYCHDGRHRLTINHMWGFYDELTGSRNLWLVHCFNEKCIDSYDQQKALHDHVWDDCTPDQIGDRVYQGTDPLTQPGEVSWPGTV